MSKDIKGKPMAGWWTQADDVELLLGLFTNMTHLWDVCMHLWYMCNVCVCVGCVNVSVEYVHVCECMMCVSVF